jgi:hypothetical protein
MCAARDAATRHILALVYIEVMHSCFTVKGNSNETRDIIYGTM